MSFQGFTPQDGGGGSSDARQQTVTQQASSSINRGSLLFRDHDALSITEDDERLAPRRKTTSGRRSSTRTDLSGSSAWSRFTEKAKESWGRSAKGTADAIKGVGEATFNLTTGRETTDEVVQGAQRETVRLNNIAGRNIIETATGQDAEDVVRKYAESTTGRNQIERAQRNLQRNKDPLGQAGALLETGTDFALDYPGASVQDWTARKAGGRETISRRYDQAAEVVDEDVLGAAGISTQENSGMAFLSQMVVTPVVKGITSVATGTDVETGQKKTATGDDIFETALAPISLATGGGAAAAVRGGSALRRVGRGVSRGTKATSSMVNPFRITRGLFRGGDRAADASSSARRVVSSGSGVVSGASDRLSNLRTGRLSPRRVEQAQDTVRNTGLDSMRTARGTQDGFQWVSRGGDNLPTTVDDARNLPASIDEVGDSIPGARRWGQPTNRATNAAEPSSFGDRLRDAFSRGSGAGSTSARAADQSTSSIFRNADEGTGIGDRIRDAFRGFRRSDDAAESGFDWSTDASRRRPRDATSARRADEGADAGRRARRGATDDDVADAFRRGERAEDAARNARRAERAEDATDAGRAAERAEDATDSPGLGTRLKNAITPTRAAIAGVVGGAVAVGELSKPDPTIQGDGWSAQWRKDYNVTTQEGPAVVYLYEVFGTGGSSRGYTVILGQDSSGELYYLGGSPDRPSQARSQVDATGLARAEQRRNEINQARSSVRGGGAPVRGGGR